MTSLSPSRFRLALAAVFVGALLLTLVALRSIAEADTGPPAVTPAGFDLTAMLALVGAVAGGLGLILGGLSTVLHAIAPRTKTTIDDTAAADIDALHAKLDRVLAMVTPIPSKPAAQPPGTGAAVLALVVLGLAGAGALTACTAAKAEATAGKTAIVDCVHADQAPIEAMLVQLGADAVTYALHGAVDWGALEAEAESAGIVVGGCAFAQVVHGKTAAAPATAPATAVSALATPPAAPDPALAALERLRAAHGGVRWSTAAGVL